jgi:anti-sigma B factor antagonist
VRLSLADRRVGDATVITCRGRITAGKEAEALQHALDTLRPRSRHLVLHLGGVDFIDSSGLGLLVRNLVRAKHGTGTLSVCAVSPKIDEVLRITRLKPVFMAYETEAAAISDAHANDASAASGASAATVLCVDESPDVEAYLRELLKAAGYRVLSAHNLSDALTLLVATKPTVVVMSADLHAAQGTRSADEFQRLAAAGAVVTLPPGFSGHEAAEASDEVLRAVRAHLAGTGDPNG